MQDQSKFYGNQLSRSYVNKRGVEDKYCGPLIKTIMNRCIHCTRCVRFGYEFCGSKMLGTLKRGSGTEIGNYINYISLSEISANVVDLCPVGALTLKPLAFQIRPWEIRSIESIDLSDGLGSNLYLNYKELDIMRVLPKKNKNINEFWISDKARFSCLVLPAISPSTSNINKTLFQNLLSHKRIIFLISSEIDLNTLSMLQQICFLSFNRVKIKTSISIKPKSNFESWGFLDSLIDITNQPYKACIILSSNLAVESTLLNVRIRMKYLKEKIKIYSFGNFIKTSFPNFFINLNFLEIACLFTGKNFFFTKFFLRNKVHLFYGKSLGDRINLEILDFFKTKHPQFTSTLVQTRCNTEGINYLNFTSITSHTLNKSDLVYSFCLEDTLYLRKKKKEISTLYWFHNYYSKIGLKLNTQIFLNLYNNGGIFLNLEQRPQRVAVFQSKGYSFKTTFSFFLTGFIEILRLSTFINILPSFKSSLFIKSQNLSNTLINFIDRKRLFRIVIEVLMHPNYFENTIQNFINLAKNNFLGLSKLNCSTYPLKLIIEDFYQTNLATKNSVVLVKCSQELRKRSTNF